MTLVAFALWKNKVCKHRTTVGAGVCVSKWRVGVKIFSVCCETMAKQIRRWWAGGGLQIFPSMVKKNTSMRIQRIFSLGDLWSSHSLFSEPQRKCPCRHAHLPACFDDLILQCYQQSQLTAKIPGQQQPLDTADTLNTHYELSRKYESEEESKLE